MIVLSFLLVVIAAVTLLVGLFQDTLTWIWASIASCVLAMIALGVGVLQRRSGRGEPGEEPASSYGPGAISNLIPGDEDEETAEEEQPAPGEVTVVPKRTVSDAKGEMSRAEVEEAADQAVAEAEAKTAAAREAAETEATEKPSKKAASKKTAKKASKKKASKKKTASKKTAKKASKKKAAKKATSETKGKAARERLDEIKGLGPAKQKALLAEFGSLEGIRDADLEDLRNVKGIGETTAAAIKDQLA
ncbi:MAG: hypothetical protein KY437_09035 [Actinobacteria bacterium]|nr:hypothetical protein [Actinomycetota bacterium]